MTQFDGVPHQVGIQSNQGGDILIEGSEVHIAGRDLNFGEVQSRQELLSRLEVLKEEVVRAGETRVISEEAAIDAEGEVRKAMKQIEKPEPEKKSIVKYLETARSLVEGVSGAGGLVKSLAEAIEAVGKLFS